MSKVWSFQRIINRKTTAIFYFLSFIRSLQSLLRVKWHFSNLTSFIFKCWKATGGYGLGQHRPRGILSILQRLQIVRRENGFPADTHCQLNKQRKVYIGSCKTTFISVWSSLFQNLIFQGFPGGSVIKNPPGNAGDTGSIPGLGISHMLRSN